MKDLIKMAALGFVTVIGFSAGAWTWDNVLQDKMYHLKKRLSKKTES